MSSIRITELDINQHGNPDEGKTWADRLKNFRSVIAPSILLISENELREAYRSLNETKNIILKNGFADLTPSERDKLYKNIEVCNSLLHSDIRKYAEEHGNIDVVKAARIPRFFHYGSFYIANTVLVYLLLRVPWPGRNKAVGAMFWNFVNQTYNFGLDAANRSKTKDDFLRDIGEVKTTQKEVVAHENRRTNDHLSMSMMPSIEPESVSAKQEDLSTYAKVVTAACATSFLLASVLPKYLPNNPILLTTLPPLLACTGAHACTLYGTGKKNFFEGIAVATSDGKTVTNDKGEEDKSIVAGRKALALNFGLRLFMLTGAMLVPTGIMHVLKKRNLFQKPATQRIIHVGAVAVTLWALLPSAISYYPKRISVSADQLEPKYHHLKGADGNPSILSFNKGL